MASVILMACFLDAGLNGLTHPRAVDEGLAMILVVANLIDGYGYLLASNDRGRNINDDGTGCYWLPSCYRVMLVNMTNT